VLLTYACFGDRSQYLNARNALMELLSMGIIPIINENDVVAVQELMFGDNDSLGAHVAGIVGAQWYIMFTDVHCVYSADPRVRGDGGWVGGSGWMGGWVGGWVGGSGWVGVWGRAFRGRVVASVKSSGFCLRSAAVSATLPACWHRCSVLLHIGRGGGVAVIPVVNCCLWF
jgi:glutamate 5-kinase